MPVRSGADTLALHPDRCLDPNTTVRRIARGLYAETRALPIVSPHGHVDARLLAENAAFADPASLIVTPDHYITRMLHSQGVAMESLGISRRDGSPVEADPRKVWQLFADHWYLFQGTPTGYWLDYEFHELFGVRTRLTTATASRVYDQIAERLESPEFLPRALFERFNIEVLATTDAAGDSLEHHRAIRESGWQGRVIPTFRPDALLRIATPGWLEAVDALAAVNGASINSFGEFVAALRRRRAFFRQMGATSTDHGVVEPHTDTLPAEEIEAIFGRGLDGVATPADQRWFEAHMLIGMAQMSAEDGLVMQLHAGVLRNHDTQLFDAFGADRGGDIPVAVEFTRNLRPLLNAFGNDPRFALVLYTLDESTYSRELAPIAGHYSAVRLGAPWWFHDSMQGMTRYRARTSETAGIWNTAGFVDDTRAFCSIPARHDLARRMDANFLGGLVARHVIAIDDARIMARAMAYDLARASYKLDTTPPAGADS